MSCGSDGLQFGSYLEGWEENIFEDPGTVSWDGTKKFLVKIRTSESLQVGVEWEEN